MDVGEYASVLSLATFDDGYIMDNGGSIPAHPLAAQQALLVERLQLFLAILHSELRPDVLLALQAPGKLLSNTEQKDGNAEAQAAQPQAPKLPAGVWPLLTLLVAQHLAPDIDPLFVADVAIAVECFICALDLLDDAEDEDWTSLGEGIGVPRMLNVSTTLLLLAQKALLSPSARGIAPETTLRLLNTLQEAALTATGGQHRDLLAEQRPVQDFSQEICIEIAAAKAGALMRLACVLGALCAGASDELCALWAKLGELLGIAHQLDNDCHDVSVYLYDDVSVPSPDEKQRMKTDIQRGKKTLPIVLAAISAANRQQERVLIQGQGEHTDDKKQEDERRALREGILTTWGICLLYRERAHDYLQEIEMHTRPLAPALRLLLGL